MTSTTTKIDPASLVISEATPAERTQCWHINAVSWAGKLDVDAYTQRETINGSQELTRDGGIRYWIFTNPSPTREEALSTGKNREIYSAVESLKKQVVIKTADGKFSQESSHGIASVFTQQKWRGQKLATSMMRQLGKWFESEDADCRFSVLYSDVGEFYSHLGWTTFSSNELIIPAGSVSSPTPSLPEIVTLNKESVSNICASDVAFVTRRIRDEPLPDSIKARVAFLPTYAQALWHFGAEEFMASQLFPSKGAVDVKGASAGESRAWGYWVHDWNDQKLTFLRLSSGNRTAGEQSDDIEAVLRAGLEEAEKWGLKKITIWDPEQTVIDVARRLMPGEGAKGIVVRTRTDGSLPCLRWPGLDAKEIDWVLSQKYAWC